MNDRKTDAPPNRSTPRADARTGNSASGVNGKPVARGAAARNGTSRASSARSDAHDRRRPSAPGKKPRPAADATPPSAETLRASAANLPQDSLAYALDAAATVIGAVRAGAALPGALVSLFSARTTRREPGADHSAGARAAHSSTARASDSTRDSEKPAAPRSDWHGATQDIAYRTLRELALADALIAALVPKPPVPHVRDMLACSLVLLHATDTPYTAHTVVDQAVRATAASPDTSFARGLVNAVLRNFLRERDALLARVQRDPVVRYNYPRWWIDSVKQAWPTDWERVLAAGNVQAPLTLRVSRLHTTPEAYLETLREAGMAAELALPSGVRLHRAVSVDRLPGFAEGVVSVQDAGAQQAAHLLDLADGMRVLDACAAPGGKTGHLLEMAKVHVVALESDATRAGRIGENLKRLGLRAEVKIGDAGHPVSPWWDDKPFDRVLADVPCSASGIVRRHPDIRWLRRPEDIPALVKEQRRILDALWQVVAPGGILLYVTCSIFPQEGEEQAVWFEGSRQDAVRLDALGQLTPTVACGGSGPDHDGFFYARFQKR